MKDAGGPAGESKDMLRAVKRAAIRVLILAWLAPVSPVSGQNAPPPTDATDTAPKRFLIESLAVEGTKRESVRKIVVSQSRLVAGHEYGEGELRDAMRRVKRLPFVLDARPSLRRGSVAGRYQLVIDIEEDVPYSVAVSVFSSGFDDPSAFGTVGMDQFIGSDSQVYGSLGVSDGFRNGAPLSTQGGIGFRQYDSLRQGSLLDFSIGLSRTGWTLDGGLFGLTTADRYRNSQSFRTSLLLPIAGNHSMSFSLGASRSESPYGFGRGGGPWFTALRHELNASLEAGWQYDTTDDPFSPLEGMRISGGLSLAGATTLDDPLDLDFNSTRGNLGLDLSAQRILPLQPRLSVELGTTVSGSFSDLYYSYGISSSVRLRYVAAGRRNRQRLFAEAGLSGGWSRYARGLRSALQLGVGVRTRFAVVSFAIFQDLD